MSTSEKPGGGARKWIIGSLVGLVVLVGGVYVASYFIAGNQVPSKAEVEGVAIGGLSPAQAEDKLRAELEPGYAAPITLAAPSGAVVEIEPLESGFALDFEAAVRDAGGGFSWNPADIINVFRGGGPVELPKLVDQDAVSRAVAAHADEFVTDAVNATLAYEGAEVVTTEAINATVLDVPQTTEAVIAAFGERASEAAAVLNETEPAVTDAMVADAVESYAGPAVSAPVTITVGEGSFEITPEQIAEVTTLTFDGDTFSHSTDEELLMELTADAQAALDLPEATNASYTLSGSTISVVPAVDGQSVDPASIVTALEAAAVRSGDERTAAAEVTAQPAEFGTERATELAPKEVIGEFTTYYPHAAYRNTNLGKAASTVNGTVLLPGEVFSLNDTLGPRTAANGYVDGYVINGGVLVREAGGGISQSATTLFNASFFAGLEDVEHKPHSLYFSRYPAGREATIYYGSIDLKFRNNTEYPILIQGYINPSSSGNRGAITFKMWSNKTWDRVVSTDLVRSGYYNGSTRTLNTPDCEPQAAIQGFTVNWSRLFYQGDEVAKKEDYSWKYSAGDQIICE